MRNLPLIQFILKRLVLSCMLAQLDASDAQAENAKQRCTGDGIRMESLPILRSRARSRLTLLVGLPLHVQRLISP